jgi:glycosyltransferase involved in cell wall biosynthesis
MAQPKVSVVLTVLNEEKHMRDLLDSLVTQRVAHEILVCDAGSTDGTLAIAKSFMERFDAVRLLHHPGRRGATRNAGVKASKGEYVAFIDGDCIANPFWLERLVARAEAGEDIVAGRTIQFGYWAFEKLQRVELYRHGQDLTFPSDNLLYRREVFTKVGGFDPRFITAEDIDLNYRAVEAGHRIEHEPDAIVYHRARDSVVGFLKQAFWNGYGRKQLTLKHGGLWSEYSFRSMVERQLHLWGLARMVAAVFGYFLCKIRESSSAWRTPSAAPQEATP